MTRKLPASALYLVIVIALVIGILCSALVAIAYYYHAEYQKAGRYVLLQTNLRSASNLLLGGADTTYQEKTFGLFGEQQDSVSTQRLFWGLYDIGVARAFIHGDTLYRVLSMAHLLDSTKWCALYLTDNGRPLGLSGKTAVRGDAFLPPAGVNQAYVNNQAYSGDPKFITGKKRNSEKQLPPLNRERLQHFRALLQQDSVQNGITALGRDSISRSFRQRTLVIHFKRQPVTISAVHLSGNIILYSDTTLTIDSTASLRRIMVFARAIVVQPGFKGNAQLFATDSVSVGKRCVFTYPSCLGLLRFGKGQPAQVQAQIHMGDYSTIAGTIFTYQEKTGEPQPIISTGRHTQISGQIYAQGTLQLADHTEVDGSVFAEKFLYQNPFTLYENYLVNVTLDEHALSPYYLGSGLMPVTTHHQKVLEWIEGN